MRYNALQRFKLHCSLSVLPDLRRSGLSNGLVQVDYHNFGTGRGMRSTMQIESLAQRTHALQKLPQSLYQYHLQRQ
jgi:hypothetical protein